MATCGSVKNQVVTFTWLVSYRILNYIFIRSMLIMDYYAEQTTWIPVKSYTVVNVINISLHRGQNWDIKCVLQAHLSQHNLFSGQVQATTSNLDKYCFKIRNSYKFISHYISENVPFWLLQTCIK